MKFKASAISAALLTAFGAVGTAQAVVLSEDGTGQVLIYPYYTVQGGTDTAINVVNTTGVSKAVKVRFLEGKNSREVLDFNLYLSPFDVWAGAITRDVNGNAVLRTSDKSCTAPAITGDVPFRNFNYSGLTSDRAGAGLDRAREGYVEVIEMGEVINSFDLTPNITTDNVTFGPAVTHVSGVPGNCAAVVALWQRVKGGDPLAAPFQTSALTPPGGGLIGSASIINVAEGTDYSYDPVALDAFSIAQNHQQPESTAPNLTNAFPPVSTVFQSQTGVAIADTWNFGVDAVSAVMMHQHVLNEFTIDTGLAAGTDWVVTFPTKGLLVALESAAPAVTLAPFIEEFDDTEAPGTTRSSTRLAEGASTGACEVMSPAVSGREEEQAAAADLDFSPPPPVGGSTFQLCWEVNVMAIKNASVLKSGNLLSTLTIPAFVGENGWLDLGFTQAGHQLVNPTSGNTYSGLPAIGFAVQKYVNGNLGGVLSNYGGSFIHKYQRSIGTPG